MAAMASSFSGAMEAAAEAVTSEDEQNFHALFLLVVCLALAIWLGHVVHCRRWVNWVDG